MKWLLLLLMVVLPLQWFVVLGPLRLHVVAMLLFLAVVVATHRGRAFLPVVQVSWAFVVANVVLSVIWFGTNAYNGLDLAEPLQELVYLAVFVAVGTVVYRGVRYDRGGFVRLLRWSALLTSVSLVVALSWSMAVNGIDPVGVFARTIASGDPEVLQRELFRSAFAGFGYDETSVRGNFRHEVFATVLIAMCLSAACASLRPFTSLRGRVLYRFSIGLGIVLIVLSMSRSVMLAALAWPLLALLKPLLAGRLSPRVVSAALVTGALAAALWSVGFLEVVWARFTQDTTSYQARDQLMVRAYDNIGKHLLTGGVETAGASSHNFVIDSWLRAGLFGAAAALVVTLLVFGLFVGLAVGLHREPAWMLPVVALLALPLVRLFTAGGGLIPPVQWVALGIVAGFVAYRADVRLGLSGAAAPDGSALTRSGADRRPVSPSAGRGT